MTDNALPTRAEVTDVAAPSSTGRIRCSPARPRVGKYPAESGRRMGSIAATTEDTLYPFDRPVRPAPTEVEGKATDALSRISTRMAAQAAREAGAKAIIVLTVSGDTAFRLSDERPRAPILAFTPEIAVVRRLALYWGVHAFLAPKAMAADWMEFAQRFLLERKWAASGDTVVFVLGAQKTGEDARSIKLLKLGASGEEQKT